MGISEALEIAEKLGKYALDKGEAEGCLFPYAYAYGRLKAQLAFLLEQLNEEQLTKVKWMLDI